MTATEVQGSAERWGPLWGARPRDWAEDEDQQAPTYEEAIRQVGITPGQQVLDVGCGTGVFLRLAADRAARAFGLDASDALLEVARERVPAADLRVGEMQALPYEDEFFDLVTGFNSFFFADDMVTALREAGRVAKSGAPVVIQVWGRPKRCTLEEMKVAVTPFLPGASPEGREPPPFWEPGVLESLAAEAGLEPESTFDTSWAYEYPDEDAMVRGMLAAGGLALIDEAAGGRVRAAVVEALSAYRTPAGGYRLENEWHYLVARA
jgi:SAM-dependent methyltransferase